MKPKQVVACLVVAILAFPAPASPSRPAIVGLAISANSALLGQTDLKAGATLFSGDLLRVDSRGGAVVSVPGESMLTFGPDSVAKLSRAADHGAVAVDLRGGYVAFGTVGGEALEVRVGDAVIQGANKDPVAATVAFVTPTRALVSAEAGTLTVSTPRNGHRVTVRAGETVEVALVDAPPGPQATGPAGRASTGMRTALIGLAVAGGITALLLIRNAGLSRNDQQDLVSPFKLP